MNKAQWYQRAVDRLLAVETVADLEALVNELTPQLPQGYSAKQVSDLMPEERRVELERFTRPLHTLPHLISAVRHYLTRPASPDYEHSREPEVDVAVDLVDTQTGEVVRLMTESEAREFVSYVRAQQEELPRRIADAYKRRAWVALGYQSWDAMCDGEHLQLRLPRDERQDIVLELRSIGMSTRAIGSALGADQSTVVRDLKRSSDANASDDRPAKITSLDGRERPATQPKREPESASDMARTIAERTRARREHFEAQHAKEGPVLEPSKAVSDFVESSQAVQDAKYMHSFIKTLKKAHDPLLFDAERVGRLASEDEMVQMDMLLRSIGEFVDRMRSARKELRVVDGGKS